MGATIERFTNKEILEAIFSNKMFMHSFTGLLFNYFYHSLAVFTI